MRKFCAPMVLAAATRAGDSVEASTLSFPAAEKCRISFMIPWTTSRKLTDCEVNTLAYAASDSRIDRSTSRAAKGEVDNGRLA